MFNSIGAPDESRCRVVVRSDLRGELSLTEAKRACKLDLPNTR